MEVDIYSVFDWGRGITQQIWLDGDRENVGVGWGLAGICKSSPPGVQCTSRLPQVYTVHLGEKTCTLYTYIIYSSLPFHSSSLFYFHRAGVQPKLAKRNTRNTKFLKFSTLSSLNHSILFPPSILGLRVPIDTLKSFPQVYVLQLLKITNKYIQLPSAISVGWLHIKVENYIPAPLHCASCQKFGHHFSRCRRATPVCPRCSDSHNNNLLITTPSIVQTVMENMLFIQNSVHNIYKNRISSD